MSKARYWLLTIPAVDHWIARVDETLVYVKGQLETGAENGYSHWQVMFVFNKQVRLKTVKNYATETSHCEPSRSSAAMDYVWKEDTRVPNSQFELGGLPLKRNCPEDWEQVRKKAKAGLIDEIPADIYVRCYN